jgi:hypothetical protein
MVRNDSLQLIVCISGKKLRKPMGMKNIADMVSTGKANDRPFK